MKIISAVLPDRTKVQYAQNTEGTVNYGQSPQKERKRRHEKNEKVFSHVIGTGYGAGDVSDDTGGARRK